MTQPERKKDPIAQRHTEFNLCEEAIIHLESDRPAEAMKILDKLSYQLEIGLGQLVTEQSKKIVEKERGEDR